MKKEGKKETKNSVKENKATNNKNKSLKKEKKEKKDNVFTKIGKYFRGVAKEIKRIKWTNSKDLVKYSIAAVVFVIFFGIYFYGIDWIVLLIRKLAN